MYFKDVDHESYYWKNRAELYTYGDMAACYFLGAWHKLRKEDVLIGTAAHKDDAAREQVINALRPRLSSSEIQALEFVFSLLNCRCAMHILYVGNFDNNNRRVFQQAVNLLLWGDRAEG